VEVQHLWINDIELGKGLKEKVAVHISDLHLSKIGWREKKVLNIIEEVESD